MKICINCWSYSVCHTHFSYASYFLCFLSLKSISYGCRPLNRLTKRMLQTFDQTFGQTPVRVMPTKYNDLIGWAPFGATVWPNVWAIHERLARETLCKWAAYVWAAHPISVHDLGHMTCQKNLAAITIWIVLLPSESCLIQVLFSNYETKQPKKPPGQWLYKAYDRLEEDFLPITAERGSP